MTTHAPAFLQAGFRPFYLGGAWFAAVAIPLWVVLWRMGATGDSLPPLMWHTHEMVFGFAAAIIVGFLFTAAQHWTGLPLPAGVPLAMIFALWVAARIGMAFHYGPTTAALDALLLPIVAVVLAIKFIRARAYSNLVLLLVLGSLAVSNIVFHLSMLGAIDSPPLRWIELGLCFVILITMIIGGRIIPAFTSTGAPGGVLFKSATLQRIAAVLAALTFVADGLSISPAWTATLGIAAALFLCVQCVGWRPWATREKPMLWMLHASYFWIPIGLLFLGLAAMGMVSRSVAMHAFATGAIGGLIMGMITRTALGHTGRPIQAGRVEVLAFALVIAAALLRVTVALVSESPVYLDGMVAAAVVWSSAFLVYAVGYWRVLTTAAVPRSAAEWTAGSTPGPRIRS